MNFENILFDFDGTIFDTSEGVFHSIDNVVNFYGIDVLDKSVYSTMIGPPLKVSFMNVLHLPESEIQNAIAKYREYYADKGMFEVKAYDGVEELLKKLLAAGKKTFVATSKPDVYAEEILRRQGMLDLFTFVGGADLAEKVRVDKVDVIKHVLKTQNIENQLEKCLMVGDRFYDINGAKAVNMKSCGILWGFGDRQEMIDCKADYICEKPDDVYKLITG